MNRFALICAVIALVPTCCTASAASTRITLPLHLANGVPVVELRINGRDVPFTLDTGASDALYLDANAERAIHELARTGQRVKSMDIGGKVVDDEEITVPDLVVDGMHFQSLHGRTLTPWGPGHDGPAPAPAGGYMRSVAEDRFEVGFPLTTSNALGHDLDLALRKLPVGRPIRS